MFEHVRSLNRLAAYNTMAIDNESKRESERERESERKRWMNVLDVYVPVFMSVH